MTETFFFYDLETSGFSAREDRIMQFAGQRTDMNLKPIGEPINYFITMTSDRIPGVDAVLLTGITPQKTVEEGISEAEFIKIFDSEISKPGTIFLGFNSIRFDDEFMRFLFFRNFYDSYEWQWKDGKSRWDLLDLSRMTRALRPEGIKWPVDDNGKPANRLELLSKANNLDHHSAHDALSDVMATIALADLLRTKQQKLFDYLLNLRTKKQVQDFLSKNKMFVYSSGKYPSESEKTAVVLNLGPHPDNLGGVLVYDLRYDPDEFTKLTPKELAERWRYSKDSELIRLPIKSLQPNRCPAIAPMSVLDKDSAKRLNLDLTQIDRNHKKLLEDKEFFSKLEQMLELVNKEREEKFKSTPTVVDAKLYDGFISDTDKKLFPKIRESAPEEITRSTRSLKDSRLKTMAPLYKARNYQKYLDDHEREVWEKYRTEYLLGGQSESRMVQYMKYIEAKKQESLNKDQKYLLDELVLWAESIMPDPLG